MIVNVRGGSGAGKSTVIRQVMERYDVRMRKLVAGRKQPLWYDLRRAGWTPLRVLGHYETECGGCDTISKNPCDPSERPMAFIHRLIREAHAEGLNVLYEGVILTTIATDLIQLVREGLPITVINLTTDLEGCLMGISDRRYRRNEGIESLEVVRASLTEVTVQNNVSKLKSAAKTARQLRAAGAKVIDCSREAAPALVMEALGL